MGYKSPIFFQPEFYFDKRHYLYLALVKQFIWLNRIFKANLNPRSKEVFKLILNFGSNTKDAIFTTFERSVANVDAIKYQSWLTNKSFLKSFQTYTKF